MNPLAVLETYVDGFPSQRVAARRLGVSQPFLSQVLTGRRAVPAWLLDALGLTTVVVAKVCTGHRVLGTATSKTLHGDQSVGSGPVRFVIGRVARGGSDVRHPLC